MNNFHQSPQAYVGHVTLNVMDLNRSIPFYTEMLGFKILNQTATSVDFTADGSTSLLTINQPAHVTQRPQRTTGMYHFALLLPKRSDLADLLAHFITTGLPYGASDHLVSEALYIADPDGNEIEIYTDRQADEWTWLEDGVQMTIDPINGHDLLTLRNPEGWQGLPAKTIMGHIHLYVSELQA
ncbi:MAG: VOC family protein, partial [Enterococcus sp.]|nr:VOC family protein [Enterococcus sp.]